MELQTRNADLDQGTLSIGAPDDLAKIDDRAESRWGGFLREFHPWRKGPLRLYGTEIDTEWRSDWKWDRVQPFLPSLADKRILDVGTGNGYHLFRLLGAGAHTVLGVEPYWLFVLQFLVMRAGLTSRAATVSYTHLRAHET